MSDLTVETVDFETVRSIALSFPGVKEGTSYGTPSFHARSRFLARLHDNGQDLVLKVGEFEQGFLIEAEPETYHITDHYRGTSLVLVRFSNMVPDAFRQLFDVAWRQVASRRDLEAYAAQDAGRPE
jgi:hypothetical protein